MIRIWGRPTSGCTQRSMWCLEEAGLSYELTLASAIMGPNGHISKGGKPFGIVDTPEYRTMNPNGKLPTINDEGFVLWESNAILAYIALTYAPALYGDDKRVLARSIAWGSWSNEHLDPPITNLVLHITRLARHLRDPATADQGLKDMAKELSVVDAQLAKQPYLAADVFTIADISVAPAVHRWTLLAPNRPRLPHIEAWHRRLANRPAFQKHIAPPEFHFDPED